jgi:hypothetical protein
MDTRMAHQLIPGIKKLIAVLTAAIKGCIAEARRRTHRTSRHKQAILQTYGKRGLLPEVDLDDTVSLLDLMESSGDPAGS